jgi:hypothetical protein
LRCVRDGHRSGVTNVLLVTTVAPADEGQSEELRRAVGAGGANVLVVAPASDVSALDWLTNDEDAARGKARRAGDDAAAAVDADRVAIDHTSHDTDAAQAVVDALRNFDADEIVVVTRPGESSNWLEDQTLHAALGSSGVPVRHVELAA